MNRRIGIYGGTFDPIHFGHINAALGVMEYHHLDQVWFSLAKKNPLKHHQPASCAHRLKMLEIALADLPQFHIITHEIEREGPSYTIDTLKALRAEEELNHHETTFFLILGEDSAATFSQWHQPEEIVKLVQLLFIRRCRPDNAVLRDSAMQDFDQLYTPIQVMEISASKVRERIQKEQYIGHLVPAKVIDYIYQNHLYL